MSYLPHSHVEDPEDPDYVVSDTQMRKRLTNHGRLLQHFQTRWKREYLTSLREYHNSSGMNMQSVKAGDVVLIHDDGPRLYWKLGVIDSLIQGNDGLVRAVNVRTSNRITSGLINRLFRLEVSLSSNDHADDMEVNKPTTTMTQEIIHSGQQRREQELIFWSGQQD